MLKQFNSNARKLNRVVPKINTNSLMDTDLTGSLQDIINNSMPVSKKQSHTRQNPNPTKIVNNTNVINDFHLEILQNSGRTIQKSVDSFDNVLNTLTINNTTLDYGTEGANPNNFEIMVFGLHIPGDFIVSEVDGDVVITLGDTYIDFDSVTLNDIYVFGKFK